VSLIEEIILPANSVFQSKNAKITRFWTRVDFSLKCTGFTRKHVFCWKCWRYP